MQFVGLWQIRRSVHFPLFRSGFLHLKTIPSSRVRTIQASPFSMSPVWTNSPVTRLCQELATLNALIWKVGISVRVKKGVEIQEVRVQIQDRQTLACNGFAFSEPILYFRYWRYRRVVRTRNLLPFTNTSNPLSSCAVRSPAASINQLWLTCRSKSQIFRIGNQLLNTGLRHPFS